MYRSKEKKRKKKNNNNSNNNNNNDNFLGGCVILGLWLIGSLRLLMLLLLLLLIYVEMNIMKGCDDDMTMVMRMVVVGLVVLLVIAE